MGHHHHKCMNAAGSRSLLVTNVIIRRAASHSRHSITPLPVTNRTPTLRLISSSARSRQHNVDPRVEELLGHQIHDDFSRIRDHYETPKHPIVLAHGLLGFSELRVPGDWLPAIEYWHGISESLRASGAKVITASVPPSGSIEERAEKLAADIVAAVEADDDGHLSSSSSSSASSSSSSGSHGSGRPRAVNIIAHSMGGLDARHMISQGLLEKQMQLSRKRRRGDGAGGSDSEEEGVQVQVRSLVSVASPHRGSAFADYLFDQIGPERLPSVYKFVKGAGMDTGAFSQLTRSYMTEEFNPRNPDNPETRYFSYGAMVGPGGPPLLSPFRQSHNVVAEAEGANDGLVSVASARWGDYKGTLVGVNHLDLINWTNRLRWAMNKWVGVDPRFNAVAFYLNIADMLAKEGL